MNNQYINNNNNLTVEYDSSSNESSYSESEKEYNLESFQSFANNHHYLNKNKLAEDNSIKQNVEIDYAHHNLSQELLNFENDIKQTMDELKDSEQEFLLFLDSSDRILNGENTTFNFQVIVDEQRLPGVTSINDISKIELVDVQVPNFYVDLKETLFLQHIGVITSNKNTTTSNSLRTERLSDVHYLYLDIDEYNNTNIIGTNSSFRNKSFILKKDGLEERSNKNSGSYEYDAADLKFELGNINNSIVADTDKNVISYVPIGDNVITFGDKENKLKNFNLSFKRNQNLPLVFLNDNLIIYSITIFTSKIKINFTTFFSSEEYALGDKVIIKPNTLNFYNFNGLDLESLKLFLERKEGHSIIQHYGDSDDTPVSGTKLFNAFYIPNKFSYTNSSTTGVDYIFQMYDFGINSETTINSNLSGNNTDNRIINTQNQLLVTLKLTTNTKTL